MYPSLNAIRVKLHSRPSSSQMDKTHELYKYITKPPKQRFTIFNLYYIYIFRTSLYNMIVFSLSKKILI